MKRAAVITDISGLGNCSGCANISILSSLGIEPCLVPTAVLSAQTGFKDFYMHNFSDKLGDYISSLKKIDPHFDAIYLGFLANTRACACAKDLIDHFGNKDTKIVFDPICGDEGARFSFITDEVFEHISDIAKRSDIITPNITELCLLSGGDYDELLRLNYNDKLNRIYGLCRIIMTERLETVVVTGIDDGEYIVSLTAKKDGFTAARARRYGGSVSGTGDIMTSIICAAAAKGLEIAPAVKTASAFISSVMSRAVISDRNNGIPFQEYLKELTL